MIKNLLQLYSLVSCLIYSVVSLVSAGFLMNDGTSYFFSSINVSRYSPSQLDSNFEYVEYYRHNAELYKELKKRSDKEITEIRQQQKKEFQENSREEKVKIAKEGMIFRSQWLLLAMLFFYFHWRLYRHSSRAI